MMLGVVVTNIGDTRLPLDKELALSCTLMDPVKVHVKRFWTFLFDGVVGKAVGSGVVDLAWSGRMRVT